MSQVIGRVLSLVENLFFQKNPLQDLLFSLNAVISTTEITQFITGHMVYNLAKEGSRSVAVLDLA